jgi:hypothetical protein
VVTRFSEEKFLEATIDTDQDFWKEENTSTSQPIEGALRRPDHPLCAMKPRIRLAFGKAIRIPM